MFPLKKKTICYICYHLLLQFAQYLSEFILKVVIVWNAIAVVILVLVIHDSIPIVVFLPIQNAISIVIIII